MLPFAPKGPSAIVSFACELQRVLAQQVLGQGDGSPHDLLARWTKAHAVALERARRLLADVAEARQPDLAMLSVAMRELRGLE